MATKTKTRRGFSADCIRCEETESVCLDLNDVTTFRCSSCDAEWSAEDVQKLMDTWAKVLAWVETAPELAD